MAKAGRNHGLPPKGNGGAPRYSALEDGRIAVCDGLVVSVNRSWKVAATDKERPVAAFKAMAPLEFWTTHAVSDIYVAAVAPQDAFWLGFETRNGAFAVVPVIDGANPLRGTAGTTLTQANFLLAPDQPCLETVRNAHGRYRQFVPAFDDKGGTRIGAVIDLAVFALPDAALEKPQGPDPDDVQPLYGQETPSDGTALAWPRRAVRLDRVPDTPCGMLRIVLLDPESYQKLTGTPLRADDFLDTGAPPPPFDPFG